VDDPYQTLGVARDAGDDVIHRAYLKLAKQHHPDLNPGNAAAEARFKTISAANALLSDPETRGKFDRREIVGVSRPDLDRWIDNDWIRPDRDLGTYVFQEIDVARVRLIQELHDDLGVNEDALPVVLSLLDQLYDLRRRLRGLDDADDRDSLGPSPSHARPLGLRGGTLPPSGYCATCGRPHRD
jgi:chaperone modulatory protein CbpM